MNPSSTLRIEAITLALVAGYVDGYALRVFGIYVSFMSGNTTMAGIEFGQGHFLIALIPALAIAGFVLGSFVGNWFAHSQVPHSQRLLFIAFAVLIAGFVVLNLHISGNANRSLPMLSVAMGMINPAVTRIGGEPVSLTFVTGTLNKMANHLALGVRRESCRMLRESGTPISTARLSKLAFGWVFWQGRYSPVRQPLISVYGSWFPHPSLSSPSALSIVAKRRPYQRKRVDRQLNPQPEGYITTTSAGSPNGAPP